MNNKEEIDKTIRNLAYLIAIVVQQWIPKPCNVPIADDFQLC